MKRITTAIVTSWLLFIGVDFFFHAGILAGLWKDNIPALKSMEDLAKLIPVGYFSFLLLTVLISYLYHNIYHDKPRIKAVVKFALSFGTLFFLSNLFGLFSYVDIPLSHLVAFQIVYFIEIIVVVLWYHFIRHTSHPKRAVLYSILIFISLIFTGLIIQNIGV